MTPLLNARTLSAAALLTIGNLHAETAYLFSGDRSENPQQPSAIHRFSFETQNSGETHPSPSANETGSIWGTCNGKNYGGLAIGPNGDLYASSKSTKNIIRFDGQTGASKGVLPGFSGVAGAMAFGPDGNLYVGVDSVIKRFKPDGTPFPGAGRLDAEFTYGGYMKAASGITFGPDGNLYVSSQGTQSVLRYDGQTGAFMDAFVFDKVNTPSSLAFGPDGNLYVANTGGPGGFSPQSGSVGKYDGQTGVFIETFIPNAAGALGLTFGENNDLYVSSYWNGQITRYDATTGKLLDTIVPTAPAGTPLLNHVVVAKEGKPPLSLVNVEPKIVVAKEATPPRPAFSAGANTIKGWTNGLLPKGVEGPLLNLAKDKQTSYTILLPATPSTMDKKAAEVLALYLKEMTGATFPIVNEGDAKDLKGDVISLGSTDLLTQSGLDAATVDLGEEGYVIGAKDNNLFLRGGTNRGAIYAVYTLLEEDLGCRWYSPNANPMIPQSSELSFRPTLRSFVPVLELRDPYFNEAFDMKWSLENKTNATQAVVPMEWGGHSKYALFFVHTFHTLVPPEKYFEEHPEYFALVNGKRQISQLCLTNKEVLQITIDTVKKALRETPSAEFISVSPNDGRGYCDCADCSAIDTPEGSRAATLLKFVNAVSDAIRTEFPKVKVSTLAYLDTFMPPKTIRPNKDVVIQLCTDSYAWKYQYNFITETVDFPKAMKAWHAIGADTHIWDYPANYVHYLVPMPNMPVVKDNINFFIDNGAKGVMLQGTYSSPAGDRARMRSWVWAKQLWDPSRDTRELMRDFTFGYFGEAAEPMWQYEELLWRMWEDSYKIPYEIGVTKPGEHPLFLEAPCSAPPDWPLLSPEFLEKANEYFRQAELLAKDPETLKRVKEAKLSILYVELGQALGYFDEFDKYVAGSWMKSGDAEQKAEIEVTLKEFEEGAKSVGAWSTGERGRVVPLIKKWHDVLGHEWKSLPVTPLSNDWEFRPDPQDIGVTDWWFKPGISNVGWSTVSSNKGKGWEGQGFPNHMGTAWYRLKFSVPVEFSKRNHVYLYFGAVDSECVVYLNGKQIFEHTLKSTGLTPEQIWERSFSIDISKWLKPGQENVLAVKVNSTGAIRGIWKPAFLFYSNEPVTLEAQDEAALLAP